MIEQDYGIKTKPCTVWNPQANSILVLIHQVLSECIKIYELEKYYLDEQDPWAGILSAAAFAICSTYHTTLKVMPGQLVFGQEMIFNIKYIADWEAMWQNNQDIIAKNNKAENMKRIKYDYKIYQKFLQNQDN